MGHATTTRHWRLAFAVGWAVPVIALLLFTGYAIIQRWRVVFGELALAVPALFSLGFNFPITLNVAFKRDIHYVGLAALLSFFAALAAGVSVVHLGVLLGECSSGAPETAATTMGSNLLYAIACNDEVADAVFLLAVQAVVLVGEVAQLLAYPNISPPSRRRPRHL